MTVHPLSNTHVAGWYLLEANSERPTHNNLPAT